MCVSGVRNGGGRKSILRACQAGCLLGLELSLDDDESRVYTDMSL